MARLSALPAATPLVGNEVLPVVQDGQTRGATVASFQSMLVDAAAFRDRAAARGLLYGLAADRDRRLFAAEAIESAFADGVYRSGFTPAADFAGLGDVDVDGAPLQIDGRGLLVNGNVAAGLVRPASGDVTVAIEVDMPAHDGKLRVLAAYVGSILESRVAVYRSDTGTYALQLQNAAGFQFVPGPTDLTARRMRVAFTIGAKMTRASFAGGPVVSIVADRPTGLLRLWMGRLAKGVGEPLNGRVLRVARLPFEVSDATLRALSGEPMTDDEVMGLIDQRLATRDNDATSPDAITSRADLIEAKTGLWTPAAADPFTGADGVLTTAPTGGQAWVAVSGNPLHRIGGVARTPDGALRGTYLATGVRDGQLEADLQPGTAEASLYLRFQSNGNYLLFQRKPEGFVGLWRFVNGASVIISPPATYRPVVAGERFKVRFVGPRIWAFRVVDGTEEPLFDVTENAFLTSGNHGLRLAGTGSADNFRLLQREAL